MPCSFAPPHFESTIDPNILDVLPFTYHLTRGSLHQRLSCPASLNSLNRLPLQTNGKNAGMTHSKVKIEKHHADPIRSQGNTGWDQGLSHPELVKLLNSTEADDLAIPKEGRALVPGCGMVSSLVDVSGKSSGVLGLRCTASCAEGFAGRWAGHFSDWRKDCREVC